MSRISKTFEIEGYDKPFTIYELRVKEILSLMQGDETKDLSLENLEKQMSEVFLPMCSNIKMEDLKEMTPSEIMIVWDNFREVNASFFVVAKGLGFEKVLEALTTAIIEDFGKLAVASSKQAMLES